MSPATIAFKMSAKEKESSIENSLQLRDLSCPSLNVIERQNPVMDNSLPPFYTASNKKLCVPEFSGIDVYNLSTKQKVAHFSLGDSSIVSSGPIFSSPSQIFVGCSTGLLYFWDVETQKITQKWDLQCNIIQISTSPASPNKLFVLVKSSDDEEVWVLEPNSNETHSQVTIQEHPAFISLKDQNISFLGCLSVRGAYYLQVHRTLSSLGAVLLKGNSENNGNIVILDFLLYKTQLAFFKSGQPENSINVFTFHPSLAQVAFASKNSPIFIANLSQSKNDAIRHLETLPIKMHWHANGPLTLQYSPDGLSLLSGGSEAVLVTWNLDTTEKSFLPRLRDSIFHVTCAHNQSTYAIRFKDGSVSLVDPTKARISHTWTGLSKDPIGFTPCINPDSKYLVFPGIVGSVSLYDISQRQVVSELNPVKVNRVVNEDTSPCVDVVAISPSGFWMVISTSISPRIINPEIHFQFWSRNNQSSYDLSSEIWEAHPAPLISIAFGSDDSLASLSSDGTLKIWNFESSMDSNGSWSCIFQNTRSNSNPQGLCFSDDGTLLCIVYNDKLALWDPSTFTLQQYFAYPLAGDISQASFIQGTPYLVAVGKDAVVVFNLISGSVWWTSHICPIPDVLLVDSVSSTFSILGPQDLLLTFNPASSSPLFATRLPFSPTSVISVDIPSEVESKYRDVLLISPDSELVILSTREGSVSDTVTEYSLAQADDIPWEFQPLSIHEKFHSIHDSKSKSNSNYKSKTSFTVFDLGDEFNRALQIPAHVAPPVNQLLSDFMVSIMKPLESASQEIKPTSQIVLDLQSHKHHPSFFTESFPLQSTSKVSDLQTLSSESLLEEASKLKNDTKLFQGILD